jgi:hypothetical protein
VCFCLSVLFLDFFQDDLRCLFSPHQVNHGGVQKAPAQVSLYKSHTTEEFHKRRRSGRYCQVLSSHSGQVRKLLLVLLPPHQRVCVVGHLLHFHGLKLGFPFERGCSQSMDVVLTPKRSSKSLMMLGPSVGWMKKTFKVHCQFEDRGASPTLTTFVNFQILSTIIHRLSAINSWLTRRWTVG